MKKRWTKEEEKYMEKRYLLQSVDKTAKKLDRSINSVERKAERMGLNHYTNGINAKSLSRCFGIDISVVIRWINKFDLPCKKIKCNNQTRYIIDSNKFWKWAENHKELIKWNKYERKSLSPEPYWLDKVIKSYNETRKGEKYTDNEIIIIKNLLRKGLNYAEIAKQLSRSYYGINHLCRNIY